MEENHLYASIINLRNIDFSIKREKTQMSTKKTDSKDSEDVLILKSGATDLRRNENTLGELVRRNYPKGIEPNATYAFANKSQTTIKITKTYPDNTVMILKVKRDKQFDWVDYVKKGEEGYIVELRGKDRDNFHKKNNIPKLP